MSWNSDRVISILLFIWEELGRTPFVITEAFFWQWDGTFHDNGGFCPVVEEVLNKNKNEQIFKVF